MHPFYVNTYRGMIKCNYRFKLVHSVALYTFDIAVSSITVVPNGFRQKYMALYITS